VKTRADSRVATYAIPVPTLGVASCCSSCWFSCRIPCCNPWPASKVIHRLCTGCPQKDTGGGGWLMFIIV